MDIFLSKISQQLYGHFFCHQGHGQLSTDTNMLALNKTQVSDLGTLGPFVYGKLRVAFALLSCQPRVTVTSCFVYKVIWGLESIDHLCINPIRRIGLIHK